jgi:hypothetical protein
MIGGLGRAATGSLRALLDSAAFSNMQGGFKLRGRVQGGDMQINPGEFVDIDATVDDINKAIMPLPFKEPSQSLFNLLEYIVGAGQRFASTADLNVGDVNPNAPVGSTIALIEQGSKAFSAIHKRLHYAQGQEFKLLAELTPITCQMNLSLHRRGLRQSSIVRTLMIALTLSQCQIQTSSRQPSALLKLKLSLKWPSLRHNCMTCMQRINACMRRYESRTSMKS